MAEKNHTLLLVDDEPAILDALQRAFRKRYTLVTAGGGREAVHVLDTQPIDLIICDQRMPDLTGVEVLKHALHVQPDAIRILLTGYADVGSLIQCVNDAQIYKYIAKPWQPEMVWLTVIRGLESYDLKRHLRQSMELLRQHKYALDQYAIVAITDTNGVIEYVNDKFCQACGYAPEELLGQTHALLRTQRHPPAFFATLWQTIRTGQIWRGDICNRRKNGTTYWQDTAIIPLLDDQSQPFRYVAIAKELPEQ